MNDYLDQVKRNASCIYVDSQRFCHAYSMRDCEFLKEKELSCVTKKMHLFRGKAIRNQIYFTDILKSNVVIFLVYYQHSVQGRLDVK